jgi:hypothetical protein
MTTRDDDDGPHSPSEAMERGLCPGCWGDGWVIRFVPVEHEGPCSTCGGTGLLSDVLDLRSPCSTISTGIVRSGHK